jgi:CDP-paratose 2-epimerase
MEKTLLVTGSSGLIGSEVCTYFTHELGYAVHGVDNNRRSVFFGPQGDMCFSPRVHQAHKRSLGSAIW